FKKNDNSKISRLLTKIKKNVIKFKMEREGLMNHTVIIVDDDSFFRSLARDILEHNGFDVFLASNIDIFSHTVNSLSAPPDLILFDVNLGGDITGDQLLSSFKQNILKKYPALKTKFVIISSKTDTELQEIADRCGADGYIRKSSLNIDYGGFIFSSQIKSFLEK
ncbi:MAG: response regulator, partial [Acidobacteria bacterium]|nr:response regulator [Acidobacteriota bacterium]